MNLSLILLIFGSGIIYGQRCPFILILTCEHARRILLAIFNFELVRGYAPCTPNAETSTSFEEHFFGSLSFIAC